MDIVLIVMVLILLFIVGFFLWRERSSKKRLSYVLKELMFFKKEKEYYQEAMLMFSDTKEILYANQSAKMLLKTNKSIEIEVEKHGRGELLDIVKELNSTNSNTFSLNNVLLILEDKSIKANIFVDMSNWNINKTTTCVIDTENIQSDNNSNDKNGSIDFLTGLSSQFLALEDMQILVQNSKNDDSSFGLFLLGIDNLKNIQISLGLLYSYEIIKKMGLHFRKNAYDGVKIYAVDTDKFLFIVKDIGKEEEVRTFGRELVKSVDILDKEYKEIRLTASVGITRYPEEGLNPQKLLDNAYTALANSVLTGESSIKIFKKNNDDVRINELQMSEEMRQGLILGDFVLYYQPTFDLKGENIIGAEALLRWKHPKHGLISADKFIEVAEKTGRIIDLGEYVFNEAILQRSHCLKTMSSDFKISINLSLKEIEVEALIPRLEVLFSKYKVDKNMISLDISEKDALSNIETTGKKIRLLNEFGLSLSLDNFGARYTSFKHLSILPIDIIKIDRSLIFELTLNPNYKKTIQAIIEMAHVLGYKVVAEGVETSKELEILKELNCDYAQGYLYSKPLNTLDFEALLAE